MWVDGGICQLGLETMFLLLALNRLSGKNKAYVRIQVALVVTKVKFPRILKMFCWH